MKHCGPVVITNVSLTETNLIVSNLPTIISGARGDTKYSHSYVTWNEPNNQSGLCDTQLRKRHSFIIAKSLGQRWDHTINHKLEINSRIWPCGLVSVQSYYVTRTIKLYSVSSLEWPWCQWARQRIRRKMHLYYASRFCCCWKCEKTHVLRRTIISIFLWNTCWRHGCSRMRQTIQNAILFNDDDDDDDDARQQIYDHLCKIVTYLTMHISACLKPSLWFTRSS